MKQLNDQYFTYRQTPVDYDGVARPSIKGKTLIWNQKCYGYGANRCTLSNTTNSASNTTCTATTTSYYTFGPIIRTNSQNYVFIQDHVYFLSVNIVSNNVSDFSYFYFENSGATPSEFRGTGRYCAISRMPTTAARTFLVRKSTTITNSDSFVFNSIVAIDLTEMYGEGNEPQTADEFLQYFPLSYYAYNSGSLLNFNGTGIKTTGKNLVFKTIENAYISSGGQILSTTSNDMIVAQVIQGQTYSFTFSTTGTATFAGFFYAEPSMNSYDYNGTRERYENGSFVAPITGYVAIRIEKNATNIMVNSGSALLPYEPYTSSTTSLPISTYFPTGMKSAGDVYDELSDKAITRVGTRAYQSGDESDSTVTTDGTNTNYALATPTEQSAEDIYYNFYGNGTEQLLPVNTDTPSTSPLLADIIYYNLTDSEVPYRVFWMINSKGERWDFTEREFKSFLNNPQGLGFSKTFSVNRYGNVQNLTDITDNFPQPNGEVLFYDSSNSTRYDKYNNFVKFLSYEPITLYYKIPVSFFSRIPNTYSLECVVGTLSKTESKTDHMLTCSINYNALSFYKGEEVEISGTGTSYTINNDSDFPIGFEITITGSPVNPYFTLTQDGEMYGEAKFTDSTAFSSVYVNSNDGEQNVELQQGGSVLPNPLSYQDLSISNGSIYVTFVKLARGESTLTIGKDSGSITGVNIVFTPIYRSV